MVPVLPHSKGMADPNVISEQAGSSGKSLENMTLGAALLLRAALRLLKSSIHCVRLPNFDHGLLFFFFNQKQVLGRM